MTAQLSAEDLIKQLDLARHPEVGWFRETYRSDEMILVSPGFKCWEEA